jgi:hypothetical protein
MTTRTEPVGLPVAAAGRWLLAILGVSLLGGFLLAAQLDPDPRGYGTHQRLGLPECSFRMLFNRPCPGCGMTTSFAHFVRGQWVASARANPAGLLMAVMCMLLVPWCGLSLWLGRLWWVDDPWPVAAYLLGGWGALGMLVWIVRWVW